MEKDGSAPFTIIQHAVNAAASGDTILVGPGEYLEAEMFQQDCCQELLTNVGVFQEELTILGADRDSVLIGPEEASAGVVIAMQWDTSRRLHLEGLTVRGRAYGIRVFGESTLRNVQSMNAWIGVFSVQDSVVIEECKFVESRRAGVALLSGGRSAIIKNCEFLGGDVGIDLFDNTGARIHDNRFDGCKMGINVGDYADPVIFRNTIDCAVEFGIGLVNQSMATVTGNWICGGFAAIGMLDPTSAVVRRNHLIGGSNANLWLQATCGIEVKDNIFERTTGYSAFLRGYFGSSPCQEVDLTGNYWFTTNRDSIPEWIWDANDDPLLQAVVEFEPFLTEIPVKNSSSSFGGLKARYER